MLNNSSTLLEEDFAGVLMNQLKGGFPSGYMDLSAAVSVLQSSIQQGKLQTSDSETTKAMFLVSCIC